MAVYGLTAVPVARRLGVTRPARTRPLLVGGDPWVIDLASAFRTADLDVLTWSPSDGQRTQLKQAGLELAPGEQLASAVAQGADIEGVTAILLLTDEDHYNALAATILAGTSDTPVYRLSPLHPSDDAVAPDSPGETLFAPTLTSSALTARYTAGARITTHSVRRWDPPGYRPVVPDQPRRHPDPGNNLPLARPPAGRHPRPPAAWAETRRPSNRRDCGGFQLLLQDVDCAGNHEHAEGQGYRLFGHHQQLGPRPDRGDIGGAERGCGPKRQ